MRYACRKDGNQDEIIDALQKSGYSVLDTSAYGKGFPDLVVKSKSCVNVLLELKIPGEKQTPAERKFAEWWGAGYHVVRSAEEAIDVMGDYDE